MNETGITQLSVIIPCYNEEENIVLFEKEVFSYFRAFPFSCEFILVDDGSSDSTPTLLRNLVHQNTDIKSLQHSHNRGLGAAIRTGLRAVSGDAVLILDSDLTFHPNQFPILLAAYKSQIDCVLGSPISGGFRGVSLLRRFLSVGVNRIYNSLLGQSLTATSSLFRLYRTSSLSDLEFKSDSFDINAEILSKMIFSGKKCVEVPVILTSRLFGQSKINFLREIKNHLLMFGRIALWRAMMRRSGSSL